MAKISHVYKGKRCKASLSHLEFPVDQPLYDECEHFVLHEYEVVEEVKEPIMVIDGAGHHHIFEEMPVCFHDIGDCDADWSYQQEQEREHLCDD